VPLVEANTATEAFLTSTTIELLPIHELDGTVIGEPGPVWRTLETRYREIVAAETGVSLSPTP
jgi:branched-subunit amino acid aminotransferase/4-amino-4-deoxychorismate lyase